MQRKSTASHGFTNDSVAQKVTFGHTVFNGITAHVATYTNLPYTLAVLLAQTDLLATLAAEAATGSHVAASKLIVEEKNWNNMFTRTADRVSAIADGVESIILEAGFKSTKTETHPTVEPDMPHNFKAVLPEGLKGGFTAECDAMPHMAAAFGYIAVPEGAVVQQNGNVFTITDNDKTYYLCLDTHKKVQFNNIPAKTTLNVTMFAVNVAGTSPATPSQDVTVQ